MPRILLGACAGYLFSLISISVLVVISPTLSDQVASGITLKPFEMVPWQEWFESWLFRLLFVFGTLGGLAGARLFNRLPISLTLLAILGLIVAMTAVAAKLFDYGKVLYPLILIVILILCACLFYNQTQSEMSIKIRNSNQSTIPLSRFYTFYISFHT